MKTSAAYPLPSDRTAGWLAILGGVLGLAAFACLIAFLVLRPGRANPPLAHVLLRGHDLGVILQSFCLMPLALALDTRARRRVSGARYGTVAAAMVALALVVVLICLSLAHVVADVLYMVPQGAVGAWLIVVCLQRANGLTRGLRALGLVAGVGLLLISTFPIGYALFVDSAILHGPISDNDPTPPGTDAANRIIHLALAVGTLLGCSTYPLWTALAGRWLLRGAQANA